MNEIKKPRKSILYYYIITMLIIVLINSVMIHWLAKRQIIEVDYGTFMSMTEEKNIGQVKISDNQIIFTDKDNSKIYKMGLMDDPILTERLYKSDAVFSSEIIEKPNWFLNFLFSWILPIAIFYAIGQYMSKKLMDKAGGGTNSMMFNLGKSNAKVYVKSSNGIKFDDVAGVANFTQKSRNNIICHSDFLLCLFLSLLFRK